MQKDGQQMSVARIQIMADVCWASDHAQKGTYSSAPACSNEIKSIKMYKDRKKQTIGSLHMPACHTNTITVLSGPLGWIIYM
jgi:hypothetical protein